jgi:hypothetical protein
MRRITAFKILHQFCLELTFDDGVHGAVDLSDLAGHGVFALWMERDAFESVSIGSSGELIWGNKVDLCPDSLYLKITGKKPHDLFPSLKDESVHA